MNNFKSFLQEFNLHHIESGNGWIQVHCPFCMGGGGSGFYLGYSINSGAMNCWKCGPHSLWHYIALVTGEHPKSIIQSFDLLQKIKYVKKEHTGTYKEPKIQPLTELAKRYLISRLFDPSEITQTWGVQSTANLGKLAHRLFIPAIHNKVKRPVSYTTRAIGNAKVRYIAAHPDNEEMPIKSLLYGEWLVPKHQDWIVLVEGTADVWRLGSGAVCSFGVQLTNAQKLRLLNYKTIAILFDNDKAGIEAQKGLVDELTSLGKVVMSLTMKNDTPDPASFTQKQAMYFWEDFNNFMAKEKLTKVFKNI